MRTRAGGRGGAALGVRQGRASWRARGPGPVPGLQARRRRLVDARIPQGLAARTLYRIPFSTNVERVTPGARAQAASSTSRWRSTPPTARGHRGQRTGAGAGAGRGRPPDRRLDGDRQPAGARPAGAAAVPGRPRIVAPRWSSSSTGSTASGRSRRTRSTRSWPARSRTRRESRGCRGELRAALDTFEALLDGRDSPHGRRLRPADLCAFPFVKYALLRAGPGDDERLPRRPARPPAAGRRPSAARAEWIRRVDERPRG